MRYACARSRLPRYLTAVVGLALGLCGLPAALVATGAAPAVALDNGLARTPPMGWNSYNYYGCNPNAQAIEQNAKAQVTSGMKAAGYDYVIVDCGWMSASRDASGNLVPDPSRFPQGMEPVIAYVHSLGLKFGIYEDAGTVACGGGAGSYGHEAQDARLFASWHVDYLKYDWCNVPFGDFPGQTHEQVAKTLETRMHDAIAATGQPIVFSMCNGWDSAVQPQTWAGSVANLWRTTTDISPDPPQAHWSGVVYNFSQNAQYWQDAHPGAWNDPDMLEVGNPGLTPAEERSHFSLWAEMAAPLIAGTSIPNMTDTTRSIYENRAVIAVDQDPLGKQGVPVVDGKNGVWVLTKPLANGDRAVALFNSNSAPATITATAAQAGLGNAPAYALTDLWNGTTTESAGTITASVPAHGTVMYRVHPTADPDALAPNTSLGVVASSQSLSPGQSTDVTETLYNSGRNPVTDATLRLGVPDGWTATATSPTSFGAVAPEKSVQATWHVTPGSSAQPIETATLTGTAQYAWGDSNTPASVSGEGDVQVVSPVQAPYKTYASTQATLGQQGDQLAIAADGTDVWTGNDEYGAIYLPGAAGPSATATVTVDSQQATSDWAKAGIMVRDNITKSGSSPGYVILAATPGHGITLQWDSDGNGYLDSFTATGGTTSYPVQLKLVRNGSTYTGYYSADGSTWTEVGTATVPSVTATQDVGVFSTAHNSGAISEADFSGFHVS
jgi:hypothetical protein